MGFITLIMRKILFLLLISSSVFAQKSLDSLFRAKDSQNKGLSKNDFTTAYKNKLDSALTRSTTDLNTIKDYVNSSNLVQIENIPGLTTWPSSSNFSGWAFGYYAGETVKMNRVSLFLENLNAATTLNLKIYLRPASNISSTSGPGAAGDILQVNKNFATSLFANTSAQQQVDLDFPLTEVTSSYIIIFYVRALASNGTTFVMLGSGRNETFGTSYPYQYIMGWYNSLQNTSFSNVPNQNRMARIVYKQQNDVDAVKAVTDKISAGTFRNDQYDSVIPNYSINGLSINYTGTRVIRDKTETTLTGSVTITASTTLNSQTYNDNPLTYTASTQAVFANLFVKVGGNNVKNLSNVVVRRTSDNALLTLNTDYRLFAYEGKISGANSGVSSVNVNVSFSYSKERVDIVQIARDNTVSIVQGTERDYDATEELYRATPTNGATILFYVIVRGSTISVVPNYEWEGFIKKGYENEIIRANNYNRSVLPKTFKRLIKGDSLRIAGYGTSITAIQQSNPPLTKNGTLRDRIGYFENYPSSFMSNFTLFDFGDGGGAIHLKLGWNYYLQSYLQSKYSSTVIYDNYGIGSSTSANTLVSGVYNGSHPDRLAQIVADAPHLVIVEFGMNELGSTSTYANVKYIIQQLQAVGSEIIVMGCPRPNTGGGLSMTNWRYTNNILKRVAFDTGSAFAPINYYVDDNNLDFFGIDGTSLCGSNLYNHPSPLEFKKYAEVLKAIF